MVQGPRLRRRIEAALTGELPGPGAQRRMSPRPRHGWVPGRIPPGLREAAALLLVYERYRQPHVLLTRRRDHLSAHAGQISLPGGALEKGESTVEAALRESQEEVGLEPARVEVLGTLTPLHIPASGFLLHVHVGAAGQIGALSPSDEEVAQVLEVPLEDLATPERLEVEEWELARESTRVPFFRVEGLKVWGATAMILAEFLALLDRAPDPWTGTDEGSQAVTLPEP